MPRWCTPPRPASILCHSIKGHVDPSARNVLLLTWTGLNTELFKNSPCPVCRYFPKTRFLPSNGLISSSQWNRKQGEQRGALKGSHCARVFWLNSSRFKNSCQDKGGLGRAEDLCQDGPINSPSKTQEQVPSRAHTNHSQSVVFLTTCFNLLTKKNTFNLGTE